MMSPSNKIGSNKTVSSQSSQSQTQSTKQNRQQLVSTLLDMRRNSVKINDEEIYRQKRDKLLSMSRKVGSHDDRIGWLTQQFIRESMSEQFGKVDQKINLNREEEQMMKYWINTVILSRKVSNEWFFRSHLWSGQKIIQTITQNQQENSLLSSKQMIKIALFNNAVCYERLEMFQEALSSLNNVGTVIKQGQGIQFRQTVKQMRMLLHIRMGMKIKQNGVKIKQNRVKIKQTGLDETNKQGLIMFSQLSSKRKQFIQFTNLLNLKKQQIGQFMTDHKQNKAKIHINNLYNLALMCKKYQLFQLSISLLNTVIADCRLNKLQLLLTKSYVLLSQISQIQGKLAQSLGYLEQIETKDQIIRKQINLQIWYLKKKVKLQEATSTCPTQLLAKNKQYQLLSSLQIQLNRLVSKPIKTAILKKCNSKAENLYRTVKCLPFSKATNKYNISTKQSTVCSKQSFQPKSTTNRITPKQCSTPRIKFTKGVQFANPQTREELLTNLLTNCQESVMAAIIQEKFDDGMEEIQSICQQLDQFEKQREGENQIFQFRMKCVGWYRQMGKEKQATLLIKRFINSYTNKQQLKQRKTLLFELSKIFEQVREYKNAIDVNYQLYQLGEIQSLDKIGEMHQLRQNYSQSLKYYQKYHQTKQTLYSHVKLAHAYSKIGSYNKKAIEILNHIIFQNKTNCIFRQFTCHQLPEIQKAVLLLATIFMNMNGLRKAIQICQKFIKQHFGAYSIFYLLGQMQARQGNLDKAFDYYLSAIRLKPDHLPSLIQIIDYVNINNTYNQQIIQILKKAFLYHHRDWQLLQLLIQGITKTKCQAKPLNINNLIECAKILQQGKNIEDSLMIQAQAVWLWAMQIMQERRKRLSIVDHQYAEIIYVRLAEINLEKGNYPVSEGLFKKILQKLQMYRMRVSGRLKQNLVKQEIGVLRRMAFIKGQQQLVNQAVGYLEQSCQLATTYSLSHELDQDCQRIGLIYFEFEKYQKALRNLQICVDDIDKQRQKQNGKLENEQQQSRWINLQLKIGQCFTKMKEWKNAKRIYQQILKQTINETAVLQLSKLYQREGRNNQAEQLRIVLSQLTLGQPPTPQHYK